MNERIKELARRSGALPTQDCGVPQWYIDEDEFEKFAKLIVRECMEINLTLLGHNTCKNLHNLYEEHFGVNE